MLLSLNFFLIIIQFGISKINTIKAFNQSEKKKFDLKFSEFCFDWLNFNSISISTLITSLGLFDAFLQKKERIWQKKGSLCLAN